MEMLGAFILNSCRGAANKTQKSVALCQMTTVRETLIDLARALIR